MKSSRKKWAMFVLRWGIAVAGIYWVVANISLYDRVLIADSKDGWPVAVRLMKDSGEEDQTYDIKDVDGRLRTIDRTELIARTDPRQVMISTPDGEKKVALLGFKVTPDKNRAHWPMIIAPTRNLWQRYWNVHNAPATVVDRSQSLEHRAADVPYPLIDRGLLPMLRRANPRFLWGTVLIFPLTFLITGFRWNILLRILDINLGLARAFIINMVGAFYSTFMPGSTGGDVLKAYYASKNTMHRTRAVMSVIVDRAIGLLALIILGGAMAAYQALRPHEANDPVAKLCLKVALASGAILAAVVLGLIVFYTPTLRRISGLDFLIKRMPMQRQVKNAIETMELYRKHPWLVLLTLIITFPVHITVVISAMLAGQAFGLPLPIGYYFVVVPVIVLVGAIPISPQGAGVMEFFAVKLTEKQGCTVGQAFALTMSIRLVQMLWNLVGGIFVFRGGYHAPTDSEQRELERDAPDVPADAAVKV